MPIAAFDGYTEAHWGEVRQIITESVAKKRFQARLVSNADAVSVIHKTIIQNLYDDPIVVVDVSGRNPNVMFELGIRLAFDKPTVIIKDDKTPFSFDTGGIEHLEYPRDLRFTQIVSFKEQLGVKVAATYAAASNPEYTTFLKHFKKIKVAQIESTTGTKEDLILAQLSELTTAVLNMQATRSAKAWKGAETNRTVGDNQSGSEIIRSMVHDYLRAGVLAQLGYDEFINMLCRKAAALLQEKVIKNEISAIQIRSEVKAAVQKLALS